MLGQYGGSYASVEDIRLRTSSLRFPTICVIEVIHVELLESLREEGDNGMLIYANATWDEARDTAFMWSI